MSVIGADGRSLLVGDGAGPENFSVLKGATLLRLEIMQRNHFSTAIGADAWGMNAGASDRHAVIECTALATDDASATRVRNLAVSGATGNFKLELNATETWTFAALVTIYREMLDAGTVKTVFLRLESSGAPTIG